MGGRHRLRHRLVADSRRKQMSKLMRGFIAAIAAVGFIRFVLSMSVVILAGAIYFAFTTPTHKGRLKDAYLLILPYLVIEVLALGYTWVTGHQTIFHAEEYSLGYGIAAHTLGHLVGGLTWEPLFLFLLMEIIWAVSIG